MKNLDSSVSRDGDPFMDQLPSKRRVQVFQSYDVASLLQVSAVCGGHRHPLMEIKESPAEDARCPRHTSYRVIQLSKEPGKRMRAILEAVVAINLKNKTVY